MEILQVLPKNGAFRLLVLNSDFAGTDQEVRLEVFLFRPCIFARIRTEIRIRILQSCAAGRGRSSSVVSYSCSNLTLSKCHAH